MNSLIFCHKKIEIVGNSIFS